MRRVAARPSTPGMRMSISTTSGVSSPASRDAPPRRRPPRRRPRCRPAASSSARNPARTSAWSSASTTLITRIPASAVGSSPGPRRPPRTGATGPGTPLRTCSPRSSNAMPEPATRSRTVLDTTTSPAEPRRGDPRPDVHGDPAHVVSAQLDLAGVQADPDLDADGPQRVADRRPRTGSRGPARRTARGTRRRSS